MTDLPDEYQDGETLYDGQLNALDPAPPEPIADRWLTREQAAELLGIEPARVFDLIKAGRLRSRREPGDREPGRWVSLDDVRDIIEMNDDVESLRRFAGGQ